MGFIINLKDGTFAVPQRRITALQYKLTYFQTASKTTARKLASLAGSIISMGLALGPVVRMWTRAIYIVINSANSLNQKVDLSAEAAHEIKFWSECLDQYNGQPIWPINPQIKITSYSDASDVAWGGYLVHIGNSVAKGNFAETEIGCSSTWRELKGTLNVMHSYIDCLKGNTVKHRTDNQNVVWALSAGSRKADLHALVIDIYKLCIDNNIHLFPEWVPRSLNQMADLISKEVDRDDHMLNPDLFVTLDIMWGPHTVDHFSSFCTRQVPHYCSRFPNPGAESIDAFTTTFAGENNWLFPPPFLVPKVIKHLKFSEADGTLIVPHWESAPWWPLLIQKKGVFKSFIIDVFVIFPRDNIFIPAVPGDILFGSRKQGFNVLALSCCSCSVLKTLCHSGGQRKVQDNIRCLLY